MGDAPEGLTSVEMDVMRKHATEVDKLVKQLLLTNKNLKKSQLWLQIDPSRALNRKVDPKKLRETIKNRDEGRRWNMYDRPRKEGGIFKKRPMKTGKEVAQLMEKMK